MKLHSSAKSRTGLCFAFGHAAEKASLLFLGLCYRMLLTNRLLCSFELSNLVVVLGILLATLVLGFDGFLALRDDELAAVRTGKLVDAVWKTEIAGLLILNDIGSHERMMRSAVAGMGVRVTHSY